MNDQYEYIFFSRFETEAEEIVQIQNKLGMKKAEEAFLDDDQISNLREDINEKLPNLFYTYAIDGFAFGALPAERKDALKSLKNIIKEHGLENKFVTTKYGNIVSKEILYTEPSVWMISCGIFDYPQTQNENNFSM